MFIFKKKKEKSGSKPPMAYTKRRIFYNHEKRKHGFFTNIILITFIFSTAFYAMFFSGYFTLRSIYVNDAESIEQNKIKDEINAILSEKVFGLIELNNIFLINENGMARTLMERFPEIESLVINIKSLNSLDVRIKEKEPSAIWCRLGSCFYVDNNAIAFASEKNNPNMKKKPLKIYEERYISEEGEMEYPFESKFSKNNGENADSGEFAYSDTSKVDVTSAKIQEPIQIKTKVADASFIRFLIEIDRILAKKTELNVKYYKTKGTYSHEVIAFTDKNTMIYFDTSGDAALQADYLSTFLADIKIKKSINDLKYIYLKSENKIFYK